MLGIFISHFILSMIKLVGMGVDSKIYGTQSTTAQNKKILLEFDNKKPIQEGYEI